MELKVRYEGDGGPCEDRVNLTVVHVDLDVDSDNNNGNGPPDRTTSEDLIETTGTGKLVCANLDDDDQDGVADRDQEPPPAAETELIPLVLEILPGTPGGTWQLLYDTTKVQVYQTDRATVLPPNASFALPLNPTPAQFWIEGLASMHGSATMVGVLADYDGDGVFECGDFIAVTVLDSVKVPLGQSVALADGPACCRAYVPTKWGGKLDIQTTAGTVSDLTYPDGAPYPNNTETGEDRHGWYTFKVVGAAGYTTSAFFTQEGEADKRPWNFYWWSAKADYIREPEIGGNGIANTTADGSDKQVIAPGMPAPAKADVVVSGRDGTLVTAPAGDDELRTLINLFDKAGTYQPLVKYDLRHPEMKATLGEAVFGQKEDEWEGHCLGAAIASIVLAQPTPVVGSTYNTDELEGLWAELGENDWHTYLPNGMVGVPPGPPVGGVDDTDVHAPVLHRVLEQRLKSERRALYAQLRSHLASDSQVWNHAVFKFVATFEEAAGDDENVVQITNLVTANDDHEPPTDDLGTRDVEYVYIISYSSNGNVRTAPAARKDWVSVGGEASWAPEILGAVNIPRWDADNDQVTETNVRNDDANN